MTTIRASVDDKIVTTLDGRLISSLPKSKRAAARKAVEVQRAKRVWTDANVDPETLRQQAHIVANSRRRGKPTRAARDREAVNKSRNGD